MMRWLNKLQLITSNERERLWRISELCHEIQTQASNLKIDDSKAELWKKLAGQLTISFPFNKDMESVYLNECYNNLENVD
jgi:hypothetical protein